MFTLRSLSAVALAAAYSFSSSPFMATDLSPPFQKTFKTFRSQASGFDIWLTFVQMASCGFAARNGRLQEIVVFFFDNGSWSIS